MNKKLSLHLFVLFMGWQALASEPGTNDWGNAACNIQLSMKIDDVDAALKTNESAKIAMWIRNLSSSDTLLIFRANGMGNSPRFKFRVISPSGEDISPPPPKSSRISGTYVAIKPDQTGYIDFMSSELCEFRETGVYKITATLSHRSPGQTNECEAVSNVLMVNVK
jgi:hypothetical protein